MSGIAWLTSFLSARQAEVRLALRVTIAAVAGYALAKLIGLAQGYWVVITAVIVMQASLGGSLKAAADRMAGTLAGAVWGACAAVAIPHHDHVGMGLALVAALAPTALLAALRPNFRVAPITAVIVLLPAGLMPESPLLYALERIAEIGLGNVVGILVALTVLPSRAHGLLAASAARVATLNAELLAALVEGLTPGQNRPGVPALHARVRAALKQLEAAADEAARERRGHFTGRADPEPLVRTLYRVRHDMVMIGRAASKPLPVAVEAALTPCVHALRDAGVEALRGAAQALRSASRPAAPAAVEAAMKGYVARMDALRGEGLTRPMASEDVGRLYALRFAFEQFVLDLGDLTARAADHAAADAASAS